MEFVRVSSIDKSMNFILAYNKASSNSEREMYKAKTLMHIQWKYRVFFWACHLWAQLLKIQRPLGPSPNIIQLNNDL
jgi:hypothetical protein